MMYMFTTAMNIYDEYYLSNDIKSFSLSIYDIYTYITYVLIYVHSN